MGGMTTARGVITIVQEDRLRLMTEDGRGLLLVLSRSAAVDGGSVERLQREGAPVSVEYDGDPDHGAVATRVKRL
jgi:hypothetical protein